MSARLITKAEAKAETVCEECGTVTSLSRWPEGWVSSGRSRRRLYMSSEAKGPSVFAYWCPKHRDHAAYNNPTEGELQKIRQNIEKGMMTTAYSKEGVTTAVYGNSNSRLSARREGLVPMITTDDHQRASR